MGLLTRATFPLWISLVFFLTLNLTVGRDVLLERAQFAGPFLAVPFIIVIVYRMMLNAGPQGTSAQID